jgi:hypothetical protein
MMMSWQNTSVLSNTRISVMQILLAKISQRCQEVCLLMQHMSEGEVLKHHSYDEMQTLPIQIVSERR